MAQAKRLSVSESREVFNRARTMYNDDKVPLYYKEPRLRLYMRYGLSHEVLTEGQRDHVNGLWDNYQNAVATRKEIEENGLREPAANLLEELYDLATQHKKGNSDIYSRLGALKQKINAIRSGAYFKHPAEPGAAVEPLLDALRDIDVNVDDLERRINDWGTGRSADLK